jgi:transcriptional regulator with XRE-family HTH domain
MDSLVPDPRAAFGRRLRRLRLQRGLSQEQLASLAQLDRTYVSSCEAGRRNVTIRTIARLSAALDVDASALVSDAQPPGAEGDLRA